MDSIKIYNWIDVLAENKYAESILNNKGIGLKDLKKLPKYNFLRTDFSENEILFFVEDIFGKSNDLFYKLKSYPFEGKVPRGITKYRNHEFKNYNERSISVPLISEISGKGLIKIARHKLDFEELRSKDSHDRDYGDYGHLYLQQFFIEDEEAFRYFGVSGNRKNICGNIKWDFLRDGSYGGHPCSLSLYVPSEQIISRIIPLKKKIERQEEIKKLEEVTGKTANELRKILK